MSLYTGKPRHQVPSRRYDIFISAFEKQVHEAQEKIKKMDRFMQPYEIVRLALEEAKLQNTHSLHLSESGIYVPIVPMDDDEWGAFDPLLTDIGRRLVAAKLHSTGIWSVEHGGIDWEFRWRLISIESHPSVRIRIDVPFAGTKSIIVTGKKEVREDTIYSSTWAGQVEVTHHEDEIQF